MGYPVVDPADVEPSSDHPCDRRSIAETANLGILAATVYELAPGEDLATTYHYHERREEILFVLDGRLRVETPDREYVVDAGEAPIRPFNPADADEPTRVFGVGAPKFDVGRPYDPERGTAPDG